MKRILSLVFLTGLLTAGAAQAAIPEPGALCRPEEEVLFSCRLEVSNTLISLCASKGASHGKGYLQYRAGDFNRLEEEFPQRAGEYSTLFNYVRVFPVGSDRLSLSFVNKSAVYELYSRTDAPPNPPYAERGLRYAPPDKADITYRCREPVIDQLMRLEDIFQPATPR